MFFSYEGAVRECRRMNEGSDYFTYTIKKVWYGWIVADCLPPEHNTHTNECWCDPEIIKTRTG